MNVNREEKRISTTIFMLMLVGINSISQAQITPEEIIVIGVVPSGLGMARDKIPFPVQSGNAKDLQRTGADSVADFMNQNFLSVTLNDAQNNPLQPDLQYRGFTASPLLGLAQGIAVYQNGARINEPLGDTVNWDLMPQSAVKDITLIGGANPLFGLNALGGSLAVRMKTGFDVEGSGVQLTTGAFGRHKAAFESGNIIELQTSQIAYYINVEQFEEKGWRDHSASEATNAYASLAWKNVKGTGNIYYQNGDSDLTGNGASPVELLAINRAAIFTGPDVTSNNMQMFGGDFNFSPNELNSFSGNFFHRDNSTDAFNGDGSEYTTCDFLSGRALIEELEEDDLEEFNLDDDDLCNNQFSDSEDLEAYINNLVLSIGEDDFNLEDFTDDLSGSGLLSDEAINNLSKRDQKSRGLDFQWRNSGIAFGVPLNSIVGIAYFKGSSAFNSVLELSLLDPITRLTTNLGTGTFVDSEATSVSTLSKSNSIYFTSTAELSDSISATLSARYNNTDVELQDLSGARPELNGKHNFSRANPSFGVTWRASDDHILFASLSQSARAPTPIELACNEGVFEIARKYAMARGEDPDDIDFECRLPNAFLADPPLEQVITTSVDVGARGRYANVNYELGVFSTINRNDILFQTTGRSTGLFANVSRTKRQGFELSLNSRYGQFNWLASYNYLNATFEDSFKALSPNHAFSDENGEISVQAGASIPGIPKQQFKLIGDFELSKELEVGFVFQASSNQHLRGDESNQLPSISGYTTTNLRANYKLTSKLQFFAKIKNVFDREYENFGLLGEDPSELDAPIVQGMSVPRFLGPAMPRAAYLGLSYFF